MVVAYSYIRFSTTEQRKGDSLRRQIKAGADWCKRNDVHLDTNLTFRDLGKSAYLGDHRKNPDRHALAAFLKLVEDGKVPRGSFLIIESLDRLTREHVRAGLMLLLGLIEAGVRIVQLSPSELIYDERSDEMGLMLAIVELSRGHRESKRKSDLSGPAWARKKEGAKNGELVTERLPAWIRLNAAGKMELVPERAATVKEIFRLAASGYGTPSILAKFNREGVPPIGGKTKYWSRGYVGKILRDRRAIGEYQPRGKRRLPDGDAVPNYFPAAVSEAEFFAARAGAAERAEYKGRLATQMVNVFAGLVKNARNHDPEKPDSYYLTQRIERGRKSYHLITLSSNQGRGTAYSFPYAVFEPAILERLAEIDPADILGGNGDNNVSILAGELATVESKIASLEGELEQGDIPSLARALRGLEEKKRDLVTQLADARAKAAHPMQDSWGECQSLASVLEGATNKDEVRLRIRSALRRIVEQIWLLVVPRKMIRLAAVQFVFQGGEKRTYIIYHRPPHQSFAGRKEGHYEACDAAPMIGKAAAFDLGDKDDARDMEAILEKLDLTELNGRVQ